MKIAISLIVVVVAVICAYHLGFERGKVESPVFFKLDHDSFSGGKDGFPGRLPITIKNSAFKANPDGSWTAIGPYDQRWGG
jgi:hypothetical protein